MRIISLTAMLLCMASMLGLGAAAQNNTDGFPTGEFREAMRLYEKGMYSRSRTLFEKIEKRYSAADPQGYAVLSQVRNDTYGSGKVAEDFIARNPHSALVPQIKWHHAMNLFDEQNYKKSGEILASVPVDMLYKDQRVDYLFRKGYCDLENHDLESARSNFLLVEAESFSDYTLPARYALGYISYVFEDFQTAVNWFEKARKDNRFAAMSDYYIMESRFMLDDYKYVTGNADAMYEAVPEELF